MTFILQAPSPSFTTTTELPSPQLSDNEAQGLTVKMIQSMNGTQYSYVKKPNRSKLTYTFQLSRMKALELRGFILAYYRSPIRITNHKGEVWTVNMVNNPFEFAGASHSSEPGDEMYEITLELDGTRISAGSIPSC